MDFKFTCTDTREGCSSSYCWHSLYYPCHDHFAARPHLSFCHLCQSYFMLFYRRKATREEMAEKKRKRMQGTSSLRVYVNLMSPDSIRDPPTTTPG